MHADVNGFGNAYTGACMVGDAGEVTNVGDVNVVGDVTVVGDVPVYMYMEILCIYACMWTYTHPSTYFELHTPCIYARMETRYIARMLREHCL